MLKKGIHFLVLFSLGISISLNAQMPSANFSAPTTGCQGELLNIDNNSTNGYAYEWDFCEGDLFKVPSSANIVNLSSAFIPKDIDFALDSNGDWFGFAASRGTNSIYRIEFGQSIENQSPSVINLGNINSLLAGPENIKIVKENGNWFGLIINTANSQLIRLSFGNDLKNTPSAGVVLSGIGTFNSGIDVGLTTLSKVLVLTNSTTNKISCVNFGNSFSSSPTITDVITSSPIIGAAGLDGINVFNLAGSWFGLTVASGSRTVYRLDFGSNLFSSPTVTQIATPSFVTDERPTDVKVKQDMGSFVAFVQMFNGNIYRCDFGNQITNAPSFTNLGNLGNVSNTPNLEIIKTGSRWYGFTLDAGSNKLFRITFPETCSSSISSSSSYNNSIQYAASGTYHISLTAYDQSNNSSYYSQSINISYFVAPDIDFIAPNVCVNQGIDFTPINDSGNIGSYDWDFGDSNSSTLSSPSHLYNAAGDYMITLQVMDANNCRNSVTKTITLYDQILPEFELPQASPLCTNQEYVLENTSVINQDPYPVSWIWEVDGVEYSTNEDLMYSTESIGDKVVRLTATVPGCVNSVTRSLLDFRAGPEVDFDVTGMCADDAFQFINQTSSAGNQYEWSVDNALQSQTTNFEYTFPAYGVYDVKLSALNSNGCNNSKVETVTVRSVPQPDFNTDLPPFSCTETPMQFHDLTPALVDGNVASWEWNFNDGGSTSTQQNPQHTYNLAGIYNVSLHVESNFGCEGTVQIPIEITESPKANFTFGPPCLNRGTQFLGTSESVISVWKWTIDNTFYGFPEPTHTFNFSGNYPAALTVVGVNGCEGYITKNIEVKPVPVLDFTTSIACTGQETIFTDQTTGADLPQTWQWNFESNAIGEGSPTSYTFATAGAKPVKMSIVTQSGCEYALTKNVVVAPSPIASFATSETFGAPPLAIQFNNTSQNASGYTWNFGANNATSMESNPIFTYTQLGEYLIELTAINGAGCSDVTSQSIKVLVPQYNLSIENLVVRQGSSSNSKVPVVTITNNSNVPIGETDIWVTGSSGLRLKSNIDLNLDPGFEQTFTLPIEILSSEKFICVELVTLTDTDFTDNQQCENLINQPVVVVPYPNPTGGIFWLDVVLEEAGLGSLKIADSMGKTVFSQEFENLLQGMNHVEIDFSNQRPGLYIAIWNVAGRQTEFRFIRQ